jgi:hypothetical protein
MALLSDEPVPATEAGWMRRSASVLGVLGVSVVLPMALLAWAVGFAASAAPGAHSCSALAQARARTALRDAKSAAASETGGHVVRRQLTLIAHDTTLVGALRAGRLNTARSEADRIVFLHRLPDGTLINHVVRLRFTTGSRIVIDSNQSNFAVDGPSVRVRRHDGTQLGDLKVSIQDVVGYVRYVHDLFHFHLVVGRRRGVPTSLPAPPRQPLPPSGCVRIRGVTYAVRSFGELSFVGEPLTVWVLGAT